MQTRRQTSGFIPLLMLSILAFSCLPCQTSSQAIPTPHQTVPVSTQAAGSLISKLTAGLPLDSEGYFVLTVTQEELTSYVALNMQESIRDPQIILSNGKAYLHGTIVNPINAPMAAVCSVETAEGEVQITVEAVALGGFPIPETFVESFVQQMEDLITNAQRQGNVQVTEIEIAEGKLTIRGRVQGTSG